MKLNGLKATKERSSAEGDPSGHSVQIEEKFASNFPQERCQPKSGHCLRDTFGKKNQSVRYNHLIENQVCGSHHLCTKMWKVIQVKEEEI
ncbi:hypothetical protein HispidOSU_008452, partial [Sigmodon hispidus]